MAEPEKKGASQPKRNISKRNIVPREMNPELTPELSEDVQAFLENGFLVIEDAITSDQVETLRAALDETYERTAGGEQFIHELLEEDPRFEFLLDHPPVLSRIKGLLGNCIQLHSATARVTQGEVPDQGWHRDGPWPVDPAGTPYGSRPGQINCGYFLDELTAENGAIAIVRGSHLNPEPPSHNPDVHPDEVRIYARPGQAVLFDGWAYHRGVANVAGERRRTCLMCYQNAWMKSRESFSGPVAKRLREQGTDEQKLLMGVIEKW
ncbi:MAG: phytanoyl-CoA dioxygenase family protein [Pseudomonadota bacterium]